MNEIKTIRIQKKEDDKNKPSGMQYQEVSSYVLPFYSEFLDTSCSFFLDFQRGEHGRRYDRLGRSMFTVGSPCYDFTDFQAEVVTR